MADGGGDQGGIFWGDAPNQGESGQSSTTVNRVKYREFIRTFRLDDVHIYRDALRSAMVMRRPVMEVDVDHLMEFDEELTNELLVRPGIHLPVFEKAALEAAVSSSIVEETDDLEVGLQITLISSKQPMSIRKLLSNQVSNLVTIPGIVISTSRVKAKATVVYAQCKSCQTVKQVQVRAGFGGASLPRVCDRPRQPNEAPCGVDPYTILPEKCKYVDQQTWKLQEAPEAVPTGEMPRSIMMTVDRHLVDSASPGKRVLVTAIMSVMTSAMGKGQRGAVAVRTPYLQVLGIRHGFEQRSQEGASLTQFTPAEEEQFVSMSRDPELYAQLCRSIAPSIFGSENVKRALACLLFGGARKQLDDGARLRGDINVLLLGDPSVAKSQFLKFIEKSAPIAVYTSGKGSSAAGLTASVTQDSSSREFYLEGGAMVLADGGVVCIDEFDKMREQDRVAIHEAMEQQTISIAKAGITTVLNTRTSVLAAANPTFGRCARHGQTEERPGASVYCHGVAVTTRSRAPPPPRLTDVSPPVVLALCRYDDSKNAAEQVDFQSTILSRFDMIFILRDVFEKEKDTRLAQHILGVHMRGGANSASGNTSAENSEQNTADIDILTLKRYVAYARARCSPRLSEAAVSRLESFYVKIRQEVQVAANEAEQAGRAPRAVPITVRQLEAIIRISESLAKMRLDTVASEDDVAMAIELFNVSTLQAARMGDIQLEGQDDGSGKSCENHINQRVPINATVGRRQLTSDLNAQGLDGSAINRAINALVKRGDFQEVNQGRKLRRIK